VTHAVDAKWREGELEGVGCGHPLDRQPQQGKPR